MGEIKRGWKVLDGRRSIIFSLDWGGRTYRRRHWTYPAKGYGPLAVFATKKAAKMFLLQGLFGEAIPCEFIPSKENYVWNFSENLRGWWVRTEGHSPLSINEMPSGTRLASAVRCLE